MADFFQSKKGKVFILKKRCIENYYHPRAIERILNLRRKNIDCELFSDDDDICEILKEVKLKLRKNLKIKGNASVFQEMTNEEWKQVSKGELEKIISTIIA